ncbi:MAG: GAF domain-containing protein [Acidobacteriota bacterium]
MTSSPAILNADPVLDLHRLQEIYDLDATSPERDDVLQSILEEATGALDMPVGLVCVVLDSAQFFPAMHGAGGWIAEVRGTPNEWSFCINVVRSGEPFVVCNGVEHPQGCCNPVVLHDQVHAYAGVPLRTSRGHILGSFCVIDVKPREFSDKEIEALHGWADQAAARLEERRGRKRVGA